MNLPSRGLLLALLAHALVSPAFAQSSRPGVGAIPYSNGVTFRVWAPNVTNVAVAGEFNSWNATANPLASESNGYWSADVSPAVAGQKYKYVLDGSSWRRDPRGLKVENSVGNSVVFDSAKYLWDVPVFSRPQRKDIVIYEMHARTFNPFYTSNPQGTLNSAISRLDHLHDMGVNAVQLMPVMEFPGDNSWGYNPSDPYAVESAYGGPEALQQFVDACHARGMAVYLDVVHNHWGPNDLVTWQYDNWSVDPSRGGIYHYNQDGLCCTDWGSTRPDYGRQEVRDYIFDNYRMAMDVYHLDGFRTDSPYHMGYHSFPGTPIPDGVSLQQEVNDFLHTNYVNALSIQENGEATWGYDTKWDMDFHHNIRTIVAESSDAARSMSDLAGWINSGAGLGRINYIDSHDSAGDLNEGTRITELIDAADPDSYWARKRSLLGAVFSLTAPGTPMVFQGEEMLESWPFSDRTGFRWDLLNLSYHSHHLKAYTDLIHARRNLKGATPGLEGTGCHVHHIDDSNKVIAYKRWDAGGDDTVVVVNFSVNAFTNNDYEIEFPTPGTWYVHFNSDALDYGVDFNNIGPTEIVAAGSPPRAAINMGRYSALILSQTPEATGGNAWTSPDWAVGCDGSVTINYDTDGGPLQGVSPVHVQIGHDGWQDTFSMEMVQSPGDSNVWTYTYSGFPGGTRGINYAFHDNGGTWDNNFQKDWYAVIDCYSTANYLPENPSGCTNVTIRYEAGSGPLAGEDGIYAHIGQNDWDIISNPDYAMTEVEPGIWEVEYQILDPAYNLNVAFHNGDGAWDTNFGNNWNTGVSGCHTNTGTVWLDPSQPVGCDAFSIYYEPLTGPLSGATNVNLFIGVDSWNNIQTLPMTQDVLGVWSIEYHPAFGVDWINFVFNDGEGTWDNNYTKDWNYSVYCPPVDGLVTFDPASPNGCVPLTITYEEQPGCPLEGATGVFVNITTFQYGFTETLHAALPMTETASGVWEATFEPRPGLPFVDVHFHDNNGTSDYQYKTSVWYLPYSGCNGPSQIIITNPLPEIAWSAEGSIDLEGWLGVVGADPIVWSNGANGASGTVPAATNWSVLDIPLAEGTNLIVLSVVNDEPVRFDSALDPVYDGGTLLGLNGGTGFSNWYVMTGTMLVAPDVTTNSALGDRAWRFFGGQHYQFSRPLATPLQPGSIFSFKIDLNPAKFGMYIDFENSTGGDEGWLTFNYDAATTNAALAVSFDSSRLLTIPKSTAGYAVAVEFLDSATVDLLITSLQSSQSTNYVLDFDTAGVNAIHQITYYGRGNTSTSNAVHLTDYQITPVPAFSDFINVVRDGIVFIDTDGDGMPDAWEVLYGFNTNINDAMIDSDGDLVLNKHEYDADTDPRTNASFLGISGVHYDAGMAYVDWHGGTDAKQVIQWTTGSVDQAGSWQDMAVVMPPTPVQNQTNMPAAPGTVYFRIKAERN